MPAARRGLLLQDTYGKVYQADVLGGMHAIRVLDRRRFEPAALTEFLHVAASLRHAHIVGLKGACPERGLLVHELPESGNVLYLLQTGAMPSSAPMQWNNSVDIGLAVASALQYMHNHAMPIAHGGLTAAAVLVDRNGVAKVADAGLFSLCTRDAPRGRELLEKDMHCLGAAPSCASLAAGGTGVPRFHRLVSYRGRCSAHLHCSVDGARLSHRQLS